MRKKYKQITFIGTAIFVILGLLEIQGKLSIFIGQKKSVVAAPLEAVKAHSARAPNAVPSEVSGSPEFLEHLQKVKISMDLYRQCLQGNTCSREEGSDPREGGFILSGQLAGQVRGLKNFKNELAFQAEGIRNLTIELLSIPDGAIKAAALELMQEIDTDENFATAILKGVLNYHDGNLIEDGIKVLERHLNSRAAHAIHESVGQTLKTGSFLVKQALSEQLIRFINEGSYPFYDGLSRDPHLDHKVRQNVESSLAEWRQRQDNG